MKKIEKAYRCYLSNGMNKIYMNPHAGRCDADETTIVLVDGATVVELASGLRAIEYNGIIYDDPTFLDAREHKVMVRRYRQGDDMGRPSGIPFHLAEEVEG